MSRISIIMSTSIGICPEAKKSALTWLFSSYEGSGEGSLGAFNPERSSLPGRDLSLLLISACE
jgi:hypothetical protein